MRSKSGGVNVLCRGDDDSHAGPHTTAVYKDRVGDTNAPGMMDPGRDSILKVIDGHGNGCHGFHIVCKSEEAPFICPREVVGDSIISCQVHDVSPKSFTGKQP